MSYGNEYYSTSMSNQYERIYSSIVVLRTEQNNEALAKCGWQWRNGVMKALMAALAKEANINMTSKLTISQHVL
jgi:hypothetical protein